MLAALLLMPVMTVDQVVLRRGVLNDDPARVRGFLSDCAVDRCTLASTDRAMSEGEYRVVVEAAPGFGRSAAPFVGHWVELTARGKRGCLMQATDICLDTSFTLSPVGDHPLTRSGTQ